MSGQESWERELNLGRRALSQGLIDGQRLTRLLLEARARKVGMASLLETAGVDPGRLPELQQGGAPSWARSSEAPVEVRRTLLGVRCHALLEQSPLMATFLGRRPADPQTVVAVSLIDPQAQRQGLWVDWLETVRAAQGVKHPHLLEVLETGKAPEGFVVITAHPERGTTLRKVLERVGRFKLGEALRVAREAAEALQALHAAKVAHRDVKPEHLILAGNGNAFLRHAGIVFSPPEAVGFAPRGTVFGSPHTMAPECWRGGPGNPQSDVYALGVTTYELVTGVRPFEGESILELKKQHLESPPVPPHELMSDVAREVSDLLSWMLAKAPDERPVPQKLVGVLQGLEKTLKSTGRMSQRGTGRLSDLGKVSDLWRTDNSSAL